MVRSGSTVRSAPAREAPEKSQPLPFSLPANTLAIQDHHLGPTGDAKHRPIDQLRAPASEPVGIACAETGVRPAPQNSAIPLVALRNTASADHVGRQFSIMIGRLSATTVSQEGARMHRISNHRLADLRQEGSHHDEAV